MIRWRIVTGLANRPPWSARRRLALITALAVVAWLPFILAALAFRPDR